MCVCEETVGGSRRGRDLPVTRSGQNGARHATCPGSRRLARCRPHSDKQRVRVSKRISQFLLRLELFLAKLDSY
jgi:hypothetical protein